MRKTLFILAILAAMPCMAQVVGPGFVNYVTSAPSGSCSSGVPQQNVLGTGLIYTCQSGTWAVIGGGGSGITGSLTAGRVPVASGATTLINGNLTETSTVETLLSTVAFLAGPVITSFDTNIQSAGFNVTSGEVAISGQKISDGSYAVGIQGLAQGLGASGVYAVASDTEAGTQSIVYAVEGLSILKTTANNANSGAVGAGFFSYSQPATGTTVGFVDGVDSQVLVQDAGVATTGRDFYALGGSVSSGGSFTNMYGYDAAALSSLTATTAAFHSVAQGTGATHYGILLAGANHNDLGSGATVMGSLSTTTNCAAVGTAANPSVASCGAAAAGHFSCATNASTGTCTVNTTAVTANSEIFVLESDTTVTGTALGVTCNTSTTVNPATRLLASSVAATSFTINLGTVTTNPACFSYWVVN